MFSQSIALIVTITNSLEMGKIYNIKIVDIIKRNTKNKGAGVQNLHRNALRVKRILLMQLHELFLQS